MKFDDILRQIGEFGCYQKRVYLLACLPLIFTAFEAMSSVFIFNIPPHRCAMPGYSGDQYHASNESHQVLINHAIPLQGGQMSSCLIYDDVNASDVRRNASGGAGLWSDEDYANVSAPRRKASRCSTWLFDQSVFESTIATDFDVVCERSVYRSTSNMIAEVGALVGTFSGGVVADRLGRKVPFYAGAVCLLGGGFGIAFASSFAVVNVCRFVVGIARMALWINGLVLGLEIVGPSKRVFAGVFIELVWCVGVLLLLLFAFFIRAWRTLEVAVSVPACVLLAYWWLIPESPRWLASRGREDDALVVLRRIAASNRTVLPPADDVTRSLLQPESTLSFTHIFRSRELIIRFVVIFGNMYMLNVIYYALLYNITNLSGDIYVNYLVSAVLETMGLVSPWLVLDRLGRKCVTCLSVLIGGAACVVSFVPVLLDSPDWVVVVLSMVGRFFACVGYSSIYVYAAELFPTVMRASAIGVGVTIVRTGSIVSPYIADVGILVGGRFANALPLIVMGTPALLVGLSALWLPETMGTKLPETLDDVNTLQSKGLNCCSKDKARERQDEKVMVTTACSETKV